jgi:hypothetical protein
MSIDNSRAVLLLEEFVHARVDRVHGRLVVHPARDAGLVGDYHRRIPQRPRPRDRVGRALDERDLRGIAEVRVAGDQRIVAVKKHGGALHVGIMEGGGTGFKSCPLSLREKGKDVVALRTGRCRRRSRG